jgi:Holliday junction resolvase Gen1 C-terminal domain
MALTTNPDKKFSRRQPALATRILESDFPDTKILKYYAHPVVSSNEKLATFKPEWQKPDATALAEICKDLFDWDTKFGMVRFMRNITPGLLVWEIIHLEPKDLSSPLHGKDGNLPTKQKSKTHANISEQPITNYFKATKSISHPPAKPSTSLTESHSKVLGIHGVRKHFSTDSIEELRVSYIPSQIQPYIPLNFNLLEPLRSPTRSLSPTKSSKHPSSRTSSDTASEEDSEDDLPQRKPKWSPDDIARLWIPKTYVETAFPKMVRDWEHSEMLRKSPKKPRSKGGMQAGAMDQFVRPQTFRHPLDSRLTEKPKSQTKIPTMRKENVQSTPLRVNNKERRYSGLLELLESESESLPSPTNPLTFLPITSKVSRVGKENVTIPKGSLKANENVVWRKENVSLDNIKVGDINTPSDEHNVVEIPDSSASRTSVIWKQGNILNPEPPGKGARIFGGFRQSLGGTLHEEDDSPTLGTVTERRK